MSNALLYLKAIESCNLFTDADEEQFYSFAGWKLVENLKRRNPLLKWIFFYTPAALLASLSSFLSYPTKTASIIGGVTLLFTTWAIQFCENGNAKKFCECMNIFSNSDTIFKNFVMDLLEKEVAFFSMGKSDHAKVCSRSARIICLKYLRKYADQCIAVSNFLKGEMDYRISMSCELLLDNPKLLALVELNGRIRDEHIVMDALRNMHQFVVVCRSEMLHLFMVDSIYRNTYERDETLITKLMEVAEEIKFQGFVKALNYQPSNLNHAQSYIRRLQSVPAQRRMACIIQLESLLQQLNLNPSLPSDCTSLVKQIECIKNILSIHQKEELAKLIAKDPFASPSPSDTEFSIASQTATITDSNENFEDNSNCYQVFEAIPGTRDEERNEEHGGGSGKEILNDDNNSQGSISPRKGVVVFDELLTKLQPRKEMALQKEREATAKFRKVPIEEVPLEDVLQDMKHSRKSIAPTHNEWLDKPYIGEKVNMAPTTSLMSQIAQRRNIAETDVIGGGSSDSE